MWRAFGQAHFVLRSRGVVVMAALLLTAASLLASPNRKLKLSGGINYGYPYGYGYADGDITLYAEYHTPCGIALDITGNYLFVADRDNNAIRSLNLTTI